MRASRAPEGRGISKRLVFVSAIILLAIAGVASAYFSMGSNSISEKNEQATVPQDAGLLSPSAGDPDQSANITPTAEPTATPIPSPTSTPSPTLAPTPETTQNDDSAANPGPTAAPTAQTELAAALRILPDAQFGEVLEEDLVQLKFHDGTLVNTWYSFQVDTKTRDITLFFAQYADGFESIEATVKVDQYTRGVDLENAEVTLFFPEGSKRTLLFDRTNGSLSLDQQYTLPVGHSMFSSGLRRALVYYGMNLQDDTGDIQVQLHLDLSGLSLSEGLEFKRLAPETVDSALLELQFLVEQIEDTRLHR